MKHLRFLVLTVCLSASVGFGFDRAELNTLLQTAATNRGPQYLATRATITNSCSGSMGLLANAANDMALTWQQRLVARICYERINRIADIDAFCHNDWRSYPPFSAAHESILGRASAMGPYVIPKCREAKLWYYYIEAFWKKTDDVPLFKEPSVLMFSRWQFWCRAAVKDEPEASYLLPVTIELLQNDPAFKNRESVYLYKELLGQKKPESVLTLLSLYDTYSQHEAGSLEVFPGSLATTYRGLFAPILTFSDSRHAAQIEKFIADRPALASLTNKLAEVRARPAPLAQPPEPPFRLGTNLVVVAPK